VVLLEHMAVLFLVFWSTPILFSIVVVLICIPPAVYESSWQGNKSSNAVSGVWVVLNLKCRLSLQSCLIFLRQFFLTYNLHYNFFFLIYLPVNSDFVYHSLTINIPHTRMAEPIL
jgi:hypothetical protein